VGPRIAHRTTAAAALPSGRTRLGLSLVAACALVLAALVIQSLSPLPARACSCAEIASIARAASKPGVAVVAGTVGRQLPDRTPIAVDTWFHGSQAADVIWLNFGSQGQTSCDPFVTSGERRLLVVHRQQENLYSVDPCVASGVIGTEPGDAALAEAVEVFGGGATAPPGSTDPPISPRPPTTDPAAGWVYVVGALGAAALLFAVVALVGLRRRRPS
jgi:hypothetical protein